MGQALTTLIVSQFHDQCLSHFDQTSFTMQICRTATFTFFFLPYTEALVQYNLATFRAAFPCMIRSGDLFNVQYQSQSRAHYDT